MRSTALLVMDVQQGIVDRFAGDDGYLSRLAAAVEAARGAGIWVIYVTVGFRTGHPEVSERNKSFAAIAGTGRFADGDPGSAISGVVLSTLRQAADLDYRLTVLADGCLDADPEVHRVLTEKVFPRQADVISIADWTAGLATTAAG